MHSYVTNLEYDHTHEWHDVSFKELAYIVLCCSFFQFLHAFWNDNGSLLCHCFSTNTVGMLCFVRVVIEISTGRHFAEQWRLSKLVRFLPKMPIYLNWKTR